MNKYMDNQYFLIVFYNHLLILIDFVQRNNDRAILFQNDFLNNWK